MGAHECGAAMLIDPARQLVTITRAAQMVAVTRRTIYNWLQSGKIEHIRTAGGNIRIFADTLFRNGTSDRADG